MSTGTLPDQKVPRRWRRPRGRTLLVIALLALLAVGAAAVAVPRLLPDPAAGPAVLGVTQVTLRDSAFLPPVIQVEPGATVTWTFDDGGTEHNVVGPEWDSGVRSDGEYQQTFSEPGSYRYRCTLHSRMTGRVDVGDTPPPDGT